MWWMGSLLLVSQKDCTPCSLDSGLSHPGRIRIDAHRSKACHRGRPRRVICAPWLVQMRGLSVFVSCDMTYQCVGNDSFRCALWLIHMWIQLIHMWHDSFKFVTWLTHLCAMTRSNAWLTMCVMSGMSISRDTTHAYVGQDTFMYGT